MTLDEKKEYLSDLASEELKYLVPFVVVDPDNIIKLEDYVNASYYSIDLAQTKAGEILNCIDQILSCKYGIIIFNNIDKISSRKDKDDWKSLIVNGLKAEDRSFMFKSQEGSYGLTSRHIPFSHIRVICKCSSYPDYLKERGNLGWVGLDFS